MINDATPMMTFINIAIGVVIFILITFLPTVFELKKSHDKRSKSKDETATVRCWMDIASIESEDQIKTDHILVKKVADVISALPNLET
jgi:hypothetical protein